MTSPSSLLRSILPSLPAVAAGAQRRAQRPREPTDAEVAAVLEALPVRLRAALEADPSARYVVLLTGAETTAIPLARSVQAALVDAGIDAPIAMDALRVSIPSILAAAAPLAARTTLEALRLQWRMVEGPAATVDAVGDGLSFADGAGERHVVGAGWASRPLDDVLDEARPVLTALHAALTPHEVNVLPNAAAGSLVVQHRAAEASIDPGWRSRSVAALEAEALSALGLPLWSLPALGAAWRERAGAAAVVGRSESRYEEDGRYRPIPHLTFAAGQGTARLDVADVATMPLPALVALAAERMGLPPVAAPLPSAPPTPRNDGRRVLASRSTLTAAR